VDPTKSSDRVVELSAARVVESALGDLRRVVRLIREAKLTPEDFPVYNKFEVVDVARELFKLAGVTLETLKQARGTPISPDHPLGQMILDAFGRKPRRKRA
jgi:hypothetical protein